MSTSESSLLIEIKSAISQLSGLKLDESSGGQRLKLYDNFYEKLREFDWKNGLLDSLNQNETVLKQYGYRKNGITCQIMLGKGDAVFNWIFQTVVLAFEIEDIELPVLILPTRQFRYELPDALKFSMCIEQVSMQLPLAEALNHPFPFVLLGVEFQTRPNTSIHIQELDLSSRQNELLETWIEFPPEYYEAGRGILSYFSNYLHEVYPEEQAKVKIELDPDGMTVRMIVESKNGRKDVIEKALHEYQEIITGKISIEELTDNERLIQGFRDEADILKTRMEMVRYRRWLPGPELDRQNLSTKQKKVVKRQNQTNNKKWIVDNQENQKEDQNENVDYLKKQIDRLFDIIEVGMSRATPIQVTAYSHSDSKSHSNSRSSATATVEQNFSLAIGGIRELKNLVPVGSQGAKELEQLELSLQEIEEESDKKLIKRSPAINKFRRILEKIKSGEGKLAEDVNKAEHGYEIFNDVAQRYNSIADWCGLPQVPKVLLK